MNVYGSFIHNHQKLETTQVPSTGEWINSGISIQWNITQQNK